MRLAHFTVKVNKKDVWCNVELEFNKSCTHCETPIQVASVTLDNDDVSVIYTCPECHATYVMLYHRVNQWTTH